MREIAWSRATSSATSSERASPPAATSSASLASSSGSGGPSDSAARSSTRPSAPGSSGRNSCSRHAREQRADHVVVGVLRRGADERHEPGLDDRQQRVLLCLVEAVDLVQEEDRALPVRAEPLARSCDHRLHVGLAGVDGRELLEGGARDRRDQARDGRLARAGRPVQDHRAEPVLLDRAPQGRAGPEQVLLACDLVERPRAKPLGERRPGGQGTPCRLGEEIVHTADATRTYDAIDGRSSAGGGDEAACGPDPHRHVEPSRVARRLRRSSCSGSSSARASPAS